MSEEPPSAFRIIGHRGSPRKALENTLASFDFAEADGADGIELDIRLTFDGEAVVHHDAEFEHGGRMQAIANTCLIDLEEKLLSKAGFEGAVSTLRDVLLRYTGSLLYMIELKTGPSPRHGLMESRVVNLIQQFHLKKKTWVLSFSPEILRRVNDLDPEIRTLLDYDETSYRPEGSLWPELPRGCRAIGPRFTLATPELFAAARNAGLSVHVWTVNDVEKARELVSLGAESIITDVPGEIAAALRPPDPLLVGGPERESP